MDAKENIKKKIRKEDVEKFYEVKMEKIGDYSFFAPGAKIILHIIHSIYTKKNCDFNDLNFRKFPFLPIGATSITSVGLPEPLPTKENPTLYITKYNNINGKWLSCADLYDTGFIEAIDTQLLNKNEIKLNDVEELLSQRIKEYLNILKEVEIDDSITKNPITLYLTFKDVKNYKFDLEVNKLFKMNDDKEYCNNTISNKIEIPGDKITEFNPEEFVNSSFQKFSKTL